MMINGSWLPTEDGLVGPDLTPMLDILFILLVFFLLTSGTVLQSIDIALPENTQSDALSSPPAKEILLEIRTDGFALNGESIATDIATRTRVLAALKAEPDHHLVVAADKKASVERLLDMLTWLRSQGIETANILMQAERKS